MIEPFSPLRTITIQTLYGDMEARGMEAAPGLVVHPAVAPVASDHPWMITHLRSGLAVTSAPDPESAALLATRLTPLTDWTQPASAFPTPASRFRDVNEMAS